MTQQIPSAKITLSYPVYACAFGPQDASRLFVGGGGGAGRSGVGNKITLLDASNPSELEELADIDLSKDEDNVTSLAVGPGKGSKTLIYAGVNSGPKDVAKGKNEHFRVFALGPPETTKAARGQITEMSRLSLFSRKDKDAYQRVLRLSRPHNNGPQLGAVSTGLAKESEIVFFNTSTTGSEVPSTWGRVLLDLEAEDIDIIQSGEKEYLFAYCSRRVIFSKSISSKASPEEPRVIYTTPIPDNSGNRVAQSFRCVRFLNTEFFVTLTNIDKRSGTVLQVFRMPKDDKSEARIATQVRLPARVAQATGLAVCNLTPPSSPGQKIPQTQFLIAVAGHDTSIYLYTLNYTKQMSVTQVSNFKYRNVIKNVHPLQITGISFAEFAPSAPVKHASTVKLASVSVGNTVVVNTIRLKSIPSSKSKDLVYEADIPTPPRSPLWSVLAAIVIVVLAFFTQAIMEIRGTSPAYLGATNYVSPFWQRALKPVPGVRSIFEEIKYGFNPSSISVSTSPSTFASSAPLSTSLSFNDLFESLLAGKRTESEPGKVIYVREEQDSTLHETNPDLASTIKADLYDEAVSGLHDGQRWEELDDDQKTIWKAKLKALGHNIEELETTVLQGLVFGQIAGAIGQAVAGG